jgi:hypothetical protein
MKILRIRLKICMKWILRKILMLIFIKVIMIFHKIWNIYLRRIMLNKKSKYEANINKKDIIDINLILITKI